MARAPRLPETLSPRERVQLALSHQVTDRVPIALICSGFEGDTRQALADYLKVDPSEGIDRYLEQFVDVTTVAPAYRGPALGRRADGAYEDMWGAWRAPCSYGRGVYYEICHYPLAEIEEPADLARHRWPQADWFDYDTFPQAIAAATARRDYALCLAGGNPFERTWWMRGFERTFLDMVERPDVFHEIMRRVTDFYIAFCRCALQAAGRPIELVFTGDDIAGQRGMLMSLAMWEEHIKPYHVRLNRAIHEFGAKVIYHSDGGVMEVIPGLMEAGIDALQALQFSADGMEPAVMKARYGDRLCFEGGVSVQTTLPFGAATEVEAEVTHLIQTLGRGGGYILGPSHAIQSGTPPENIVAMFEAAVRCPLPPA